ncbi:transcriptional regulator FtsR [Timonella sp. A28]|uniref:transcriptional regulator FtsR n=1 Tax=Timonella sp. A28 TaxID=3442640 RepID=UPI003EB894C6
MRISDVLAALQTDFPAVSHSKLRFLEEQGLVSPYRAASGYRHFSAADLERLRFVLTEQRDHYLPLKVIKEKLKELDRGVEASPQAGAPRLASSQGLTRAQDAVRRLEDVAAAAGVSSEFVEDLRSAGVLRTRSKTASAADYESCLRRDLEIVELANKLHVFGIDWRHLRTMKLAADRQVSVIDQSLTHLSSKKTTSAQGQAQEARHELAQLLAQLHAVWLRDAVEQDTL